MNNPKNSALAQSIPSGEKSQIMSVIDREALALLVEETDAQVREAIAQFEAIFALIKEMLHQMFEQLRKMRPQIETDPKILRRPLEVLKAIATSTAEMEENHLARLQSFSTTAEKLASQAAAENDPEIKRQLLTVSDQLISLVASSTAKARKTEAERRHQLEELASLSASIEEMIQDAALLATPSKEKEPK